MKCRLCSARLLPQVVPAERNSDLCIKCQQSIGRAAEDTQEVEETLT